MIFLLLILSCLLLTVYGPDITHRPMSFDEEVQWLMGCGLTEKEAVEIASL